MFWRACDLALQLHAQPGDARHQFSCARDKHRHDREFVELVRAPFFYALGLALPLLALLGIRGHGREGKNFALVASILGLFVLALLLMSCGGGGSNGGSGGGGQQHGTQPGTYTIPVTGTSGTLSHQSASTATLIVNQ